MPTSQYLQTAPALATPIRNDIAAAGLTMVELRARIIDAQDFHAGFLSGTQCDTQGLHTSHAPEWREKFIRRNSTIPHAVLAKLGANLIAKRRPKKTQAFHDHIVQGFTAGRTLNLRVVVGPVKNVQRFGTYQSADMAEYLMLIQLARVVQTIAAIYPHGVRVQMVPDDLRGAVANGWPASHSKTYVSSLQRMVAQLQLDNWLTVEDGQARLYEQYRVAEHMHAAKLEVIADMEFAKKFSRACDQARENLCMQQTPSQKDIHDSAMRYLVAHRAEILSGMWSPLDALPLMYANHADNYQLFTMGRGLTKLPWQIRLPFAVLATNEHSLVPPLPCA